MPGAGLPKNYEFVIDGNDVTSFVVEAAVLKRNGVGEADLVLVRDVSSLLTLDDELIGKTVTVKRGVASATEDFLFEGEIVNYKPRESSRIVLECADRMFRAVKHIFNNVYEQSDSFGGEPDLIWKDLMDRSGVPTSSTYIEEPDASLVLTKFIVDDARAFERADRIIKILDWKHCFDETVGFARFESRGAQNAGVTLTVGNNVVNNPGWEFLGENLVQSLIVRGAVQETETEESLAVDGVETTFGVEEIPEDTRIVIDGSEQRFGINGVTPDADFDYYVDKFNKQIIFNSAPSGTTANVTYTYLVERPVQIEAGVSIQKYSTTGGTAFPYTEVKHLSEAQDVDDAFKYAEGLLDANSSLDPGTDLAVRNVTGLRPNMRVSVVDNGNGINQDLLIDEIEFRYPYDVDVVRLTQLPIDLGSIAVSHDSRIKRLEEELSKGKRQILVGKGVGRQLTVGRRIFTKEVRTLDTGGGSAGFILDHGAYGILDTSGFDWSSEANAFGSGYSVDWRMPAKDIYAEYILDTDFQGANNTATWNTGVTATITTTGGTAADIGNPLAKGPTFSEVKMTIYFTGTINSVDVGATADFTGAQNFTTWSSGTEKTLTLSPTLEELYFRINMGSTAVISTQKDSSNQTSAPAVRIRLSSYT